MAKAQVKKAAARTARRATKATARVKTAARTARKQVVAKTARPVKAAKKAAKTAAKVISKAKPKTVAKAAVKAAAKSKPAKAMKAAVAALPKKPTAVPPPATRGPVAARVPAPPVADAKKTRTRRARAPRVHSDGAPVANWLPQGEKPRPSSFIPAPARAEAPSLIAAPPASSDRLIRPEDVTEFVTRTVPIRVDVEQGGGKVYIGVNPEDVVLRAGEGIEWDFRYIGGADVTVDELIVDFEKSSPFVQGTFKTRKPGAARPHRQLSGPVAKNAPAQRIQYTIRAMNPFKTEMAIARPFITVAK